MARKKRILNCKKLDKIGTVFSDTSRKIGNLIESGSRIHKGTQSEGGVLHNWQIIESDGGNGHVNKGGKGEGMERGGGGGGKSGGWVGEGDGDEVPILIGDLGGTEDTMEYKVMSNQFDSNSSGRRTSVDGYGRRYSGDFHLQNGDFHAQHGDFHLDNSDLTLEIEGIREGNEVRKRSENDIKYCGVKNEYDIGMVREMNLSVEEEEGKK